jgi:predicted Zn-dependent protease
MRRAGAGIGLSGAWLVAVALHASVAQAHGDAHARIAMLSQRIAAEPDNVSWRLRRADLFRSHHQWAEAESDLARVRELTPDANTWRLPLARLRLDQGRPADALAVLDPASDAASQPDASDAVGLRLRAQALSALGRYAEAAALQAARLAILDAAEVGDYLDWAGDATRAGDVAMGLRALDAGMQRLGPLVVLQRRAVEIEQGQRHWPEALARLATLLQSSPRKEGLLLWRAQIERQADLPAQALASLAEASAALDLLPPAPRTASAMTTLRAQIEAERRLFSSPN